VVSTGRHEAERSHPSVRTVGPVPVISVIVPVLNGGHDLVEQLEALAAQRSSEPWEVIIADNGSTDGSLQVAQEWSLKQENFRAVDASAVAGPAAARNAGVVASAGEYLAFCDADDVVSAGWIEACVQALHHADLAAGRFDFLSLNDFHPPPPQSAGIRPLGFLPAGLGANLAVRRAAFDQVGGFDERLVPLGDDTDLCWRLQLQGFHFADMPDAMVAKRARTTFLEVFRQCLGFGRTGPLLYQRYRAEGLRPDIRGALKAWAWLVVSAPLIFQPTRRFEWARGTGIRLGRLQASWRLRVFFP
jgi:GT2 family glycosyltransferase